RNIQISFDWMISGCVGLCIHCDQATDGGDGRPRLGVVLVGIALILGTNALADGDGDLVVVGGVNADRATIIEDLQSSSRGKILLDVVIEIVLLSAKEGEVSVVEVEIFTQAGPVDMF